MPLGRIRLLHAALALVAFIALCGIMFGCARPIDTRPRYVPLCTFLIPTPGRDTLGRPMGTATETKPCVQ